MTCSMDRAPHGLIYTEDNGSMNWTWDPHRRFKSTEDPWRIVLHCRDPGFGWAHLSLQRKLQWLTTKLLAALGGMLPSLTSSWGRRPPSHQLRPSQVPPHLLPNAGASLCMAPLLEFQNTQNLMDPQSANIFHSTTLEVLAATCCHISDRKVRML